MDIVLINPGDRKQIYQTLGIELAAIEPPFWTALIAAYLRNKGFDVAIVDADAENIAPGETATRVEALKPLLAAVIVYGSNPSASTPNMTIAGKICKAIKENTSAKVALGGLHPSALPRKTLEEEEVDFVIEGEGPLTLERLLQLLRANNKDYSQTPGLWYFDNGAVRNNARAPLIADLDNELPGAAWDLLPMERYRAHNWHCFDDIDRRMPYGAIYTSFGCPYNCTFCCINAPFGKPGIRYRSPEKVVEEIELLVSRYGVKNIKIIDELFVLNEKHYMGIVDLIIRKGYALNLWAYARVDTIKQRNLKRMKQAGINWLGLGIESASAAVRAGANKQVRAKDITQIARMIQSEGIRVGANYIFGLPDDTLGTMRETLDVAKEINSELANFYSAMAYPGSKLYDIAIKNGWELPPSWHGFSQYSYETLPLPTKNVSAREVLKFRDEAFTEYFSNPAYLTMMEAKFGTDVRRHIERMTSVKLGRKLLAG